MLGSHDVYTAATLDVRIRWKIAVGAARSELDNLFSINVMLQYQVQLAVPLSI